MKLIVALLVGLTAIAVAIGCESNTNAQDAGGGAKAGAGDHKMAVAKIEPSKASATQPANGQPKGTIEFHQSGEKVHITGEISGLKPNGKHAIHIHEKPDMSAPDLMSTGGHYNPEKHQHGGPTTSKAIHAGDLGNLQANDKGVAKMDLTVDNISLGGEKNNVVGLPVIIHAKEDDFKTQPTGNAGGRIGGGLIEMQK